ncbi:MAG: hypothetical protein J6A25_00040 [Lachnospiraceae bacterium]|nr:hypothetical protein [Lachnospiraceae bacterium]
MSKFDYLTLLVGEDILLKEFNLILHQPRIRDISIIGEENFFKMLSFLFIEKENIINVLSEKKDRAEVEAVYKDLTDYEIFYSTAASDKQQEGEISIREGATQIFMLLFPDYHISFEENGIFYSDKDNNYRIISKHDYSILRDQIKEVLCLDGLGGEEDYNPADDRAREIAEKLKARKKRLAKDKGKKKDMIANYVSSLSIALPNSSINYVSSLTLFQLYDQLKRYGAYKDSELRLQAHMAGAKDVEQKDWLGPLEK